MIDFYRLLPPFWFQNHKTCPKVDKIINDTLDSNPTVVLSRCEASLNGLVLWVENWPYAYGYMRTDPLELLPSVKTRIRLRKYIRDIQRAEIKEKRDEILNKYRALS